MADAALGVFYGWGDGQEWGFGNGKSEMITEPTPLSTLFNTFAYIDCGYRHFASIDSNGRVRCWGIGKHYRLGNGSEENSPIPSCISPLRVPEGYPPAMIVKQVACGFAHTLLLSENQINLVWSFGWAGDGSLGIETTENIARPTLVSSLCDCNIVQIAAGGTHSSAVSEDGRLFTWGSGENGRLGHGSNEQKRMPTLVVHSFDQSPLPPIKKISCGYRSSAAVCLEGRLFTWGHGAHGVLGHGTTTLGIFAACLEDVCQPKVVEELSNIHIIDISVGGYLMAAIDQEGKLYTWSGSQTLVNDALSQPQQIDIDQCFMQVSCGEKHAGAVSRKGELFMWSLVEDVRFRNHHSLYCETDYKDGRHNVFNLTREFGLIASFVKCGHRQTFVCGIQVQEKGLIVLDIGSTTVFCDWSNVCSENMALRFSLLVEDMDTELASEFVAYEGLMRSHVITQLVPEHSYKLSLVLQNASFRLHCGEAVMVKTRADVKISTAKPVMSKMAFESEDKDEETRQVGISVKKGEDTSSATKREYESRSITESKTEQSSSLLNSRYPTEVFVKKEFWLMKAHEISQIVQRVHENTSLRVAPSDSPAHFRVYATSDIHTDFAENMKWLESISSQTYKNDIIIVAGDISDKMDIIERSLSLLHEKFRMVFYTPGNHELWTLREKSQDSFDKLVEIIELCERIGIYITPCHVSPNLVIAPLFSWYSPSFDPTDKMPVFYEIGFDSACNWPYPEGFRATGDTSASFASADDISTMMLKLNEPFLDLRNVLHQDYHHLLDESTRFEEPNVITLSHFLPHSSLCRWVRSDLYKVIGNTLIDQQLRAMNSKMHIFGHTHIPCEMICDGVTYIQIPLGYPRQRSWFRGNGFSVVWTA